MTRTWPILIIAMLVCNSAAAVDFDEYGRLTAAANGLLDLIDQADESGVPPLREAAVAADLAVIQWLDNFFTTEEFAALPADQQAAATSDRYRWEYNMALQLIALERCDEARSRIRSLLDSAFSDEELRPLLTATYEEAVVCSVAEPELVLTALRITSDPSGAEVLLDNQFVGLTPYETELESGSYLISVRAEGFEAQSQRVEAQGEPIELGPIVLVVPEPDPEIEPRGGDTPWASIGLWTLGAGGIGTGVALLVTAGTRQDRLDVPPPGFRPTDPGGEQDTIDNLTTWGYVTGGIGLASAIVGTILFVTGSHDDRVSLGPWYNGDAAGLYLGGRFP